METKKVTTITLDKAVLDKIKPILQNGGYKLSSVINLYLKKIINGEVDLP